MAVGIVSASRAAGELLLEVCPNYEGGCLCPEAGRHQRYRFSDQAPEGDGRTFEEWAQACAREALLLAAEATVAAPQAELAELRGLTL